MGSGAVTQNCRLRMSRAALSYQGRARAKCEPQLRKHLQGLSEKHPQ